MRGAFRPDLYLVTSRDLCLGRSLLRVVDEAVAGGVTLVQLREKEISTREFVALASDLKNLLDRHGVPLIINDRVDVALASGARGVHVGNSDMDPRDVRRILGPEAIIGVSIETLADLPAALDMPVDYLAASPVFSTRTKHDIAHPLGLEGVRSLRASCSRPVVAIGGIGAHNAAGVVAAGADGIAVVSAICGANCPRSAAERLHFEVLQGKRRR